MAEYRTRGITTLGVNPVRGYALRDIEFLRAHPEIVDLLIVFPPGFAYDLSPLAALRDLRSLTVPATVDLSQFPRLMEFRGQWHIEGSAWGQPRSSRWSACAATSRRLGTRPNFPICPP